MNFLDIDMLNAALVSIYSKPTDRSHLVLKGKML